MMPDLNGDEVLKIIKGNPDTRDIPVVMISADSDTEKVSKCIELGADDYLPKPFNPTILRARIGSAVRQGSLRALQSEYVGKMEQAKKDSDSLLKNLFLPKSRRGCETGTAISRIISRRPPSFSRTWSASVRSRRG
jgi:DNA-binding response OmpR family regulator